MAMPLGIDPGMPRSNNAKQDSSKKARLVQAQMPLEMVNAIDATGSTRSDFIRTACQNELARRDGTARELTLSAAESFLSLIKEAEEPIRYALLCGEGLMRELALLKKAASAEVDHNPNVLISQLMERFDNELPARSGSSVTNGWVPEGQSVTNGEPEDGDDEYDDGHLNANDLF